MMVGVKGLCCGCMAIGLLVAGLATVLPASRGGAFAGAFGAGAQPPSIASLLKPAVYSRVIHDREVMTHASLDDGEGDMRRYSYYAAMLVHASLPRVHDTLTDYRIYAQLIPYIDEADYSPLTHILELGGGIWKFRLRSRVRFEERGPRWIHYQIIGGHFTGLTGDIYFESAGESGTLVYFNGDQLGTHWPPKFVIERGAEIVFSFTGRKMRSYIKEQKAAKPPANAPPREAGGTEEIHDAQAPQPRSRL